MNAHDKSNLSFLINVSSSALKEWWDQADESDRLYAFELLEAARSELIETSLSFSDLREARVELSQFTLPNL
jgi:hypothetical protein